MSYKKNLSVSHTGVISLRFDEFFEIGFHKWYPLFDTSLRISTPFLDIPNNLLCLDISGRTPKSRDYFSLLLRAKQRSASASANIFMSRRSRTRWSKIAKIPSSMRTWGEYILVVVSSRWWFSKEYIGRSATRLEIYWFSVQPIRPNQKLTLV